MKKLITIILILALLLPAAALAVDESKVVGCWAHYEHPNSKTLAMECLYLEEDHKCYFMLQIFYPWSVGNGTAYIGTWEANEDGTITAQIGDDTYLSLIIPEGSFGVAMVPEDNRIFVNLSVLGIE